MRFYTSVSRLGGKIKARGYDEDGYRIELEETFEPVLFVNSPDESEWKTIYGGNVKPIKFENMYEAGQFVKQYEGTPNFQVSGNTNYVSQWMQRTFPLDIDYDPDLIRIWNIDIEVWSEGGFPEPNRAAHPVTAITFFDSKEKHYYTYAQQKTSGTNVTYQVSRDNHTYVDCADEQELLFKFIDHWAGPKGPDMVTGWNIRFFDIPYLVNRIRNVISDTVVKSMSPWRHVNHRSIFTKGKENDVYDLAGIQIVDYMDVFKKFAVFKYGNQETYALDHIAHIVLGDRKLSYEEHGSLNKLYVNDYQKFIDYNVKDVELVQRMEDQESFLEVAIVLAYKGGINVADTMGTVAIWDSLIYRYLTLKKVAVPNTRGKEKTDFGGGFVKEVVPGMYDNVVSFDLASLYPNIIVQWNISPETLLGRKASNENGRTFNIEDALQMKEYHAIENHTVTGDGSQFSKDKKGFLPAIVTEMYAQRKKLKKQQIEGEKKAVKDKSYALKKEIAGYYNEQMAIKLLMNSLYGATGNQYFRYFDQRIAEGITTSGRLAIRWAEQAMNKEMNKIMDTEDTDYVIAIDTDSLYVDFDPLVKKFNPENCVDFLCNVADDHFQKALAKSYNNLFEYVNGMESRLEMDREVVSDRAIWTGAKNYAMIIRDNEGIRYEEPKYKIMGLSGKKATAAQNVREAIMHIYKLGLTSDEKAVQDYIETKREEFYKLRPEEIASPRGVNGLAKYADRAGIYKKGTQAHIRAALIYNHHLKDKKLTNKYAMCEDGEKMRFVYLNQPNKLKTDVVGFVDVLPEEFGIHNNIDYDTVFEKAFITPVEIYLDAIGWKAVSVPSLEDFFL
ncbi:MAG: DNA polymerase domain-containing protein [Pseudomonadales bacterium]